MRKNPTSTSTNTLLNYFTRSPAAAAAAASKNAAAATAADKKNTENGDVTNERLKRAFVASPSSPLINDNSNHCENGIRRRINTDQSRLSVRSAHVEKITAIDLNALPGQSVAVEDDKIIETPPSIKRTRTRRVIAKVTKPSKADGDTTSSTEKFSSTVITAATDDIDDTASASISPPCKRRRKRIIAQLDSDEDDIDAAATAATATTAATAATAAVDIADDYKPDDTDSSEDEHSSSLSESTFEASDSQQSYDDEDDDEKNLKNKRNRFAACAKKKTNKKTNSSATAASVNNRSSVSVVSASPRLSCNEFKAARSTSTSVSTNNNDNVDHGDTGNDTYNWPHLKLPFLQPDKIKDAKRRTANDPNYDPRTLFVPDDFKNKLTPAVRQWWEMKSQNFDVVLFFKVGKFYELYHMDAVIAANELNLTFMRGEFAHVGFPEIAYGRFSSTLVEKGYKVARVEQTETPDMMNERCKTMSSKCTKFDKVVKREICQITSRGTRIFGVLDGETKEAESNYLLAIVEKETDTSNGYYGVCFVDTSIGVFYVGQFVDDRHHSRLRTLIAHYTPVQILFEKNRIGEKIRSLLDTTCNGVVKEALNPDTEFWSASQTLLTLAEQYYRNNDTPVALQKFLHQASNETLSNATITAAENELGIRAVGAIVWYLQRSLIDHHLFTMARFELYEPLDTMRCDAKTPSITDFDNTDTRSKFTNDKRNMILDAVTLKNLQVLQNTQGSVHGSLIHVIDNCRTPFGKRLLQRWMCNPLADIGAIEARQKAVEFLISCPILEQIRDAMAQLPDLERLLTRIYSQSTNGIKESHPDTRAFLFEEKTYTKKKIVDFISILKGFKNTTEIIIKLQKFVDEQEEGGEDVSTKNTSIPTIILRCLMSTAKNTNGLFPQLTNTLNFFQKAFDHEQAQKEGRILPSAGTDADYDRVVDRLKTIETDSNLYLNEQRSYFGYKVNFVGTDKKRFQLEVPESAIKKANAKYELTGQRKGFKRYVTRETREFLDRIIAAEEFKTNVLKNLRQRIFAKFCEKFNQWNDAIRSISIIDVLVSFAQYRINQSSPTCMPQFYRLTIDQNERQPQQPFVYLKQGRYPCSNDDETFIPNDTFIGRFNDNGDDDDDVSNASSLIVVTGPNMGGKSTLMRQLGLIVIMAHMGCYVPAVKLKLSVVDRIFTRLGANDDIMAGESTFYVELCETGCILQHSTRHSLILIDELGRGTSTYDGTAIASAVLKELCHIECRTLFSTHYHSLVEKFRKNSSVSFGHMACMVENEYNEKDGGTENDQQDVNNVDDGEKSNEKYVTFLYKFTEGACPKSYGFNAARLAGMPKCIINSGLQRAKQLESEIRKRNLFKNIFKNRQPRDDRIRTLLEAI